MQRNRVTYYISKFHAVFSWGVGVKNVSNCKSDLQDHSRALATVPFNSPHTISY